LKADSDFILAVVADFGYVTFITGGGFKISFKREADSGFLTCDRSKVVFPILFLYILKISSFLSKITLNWIPYGIFLKPAVKNPLFLRMLFIFSYNSGRVSSGLIFG